MAVRWHIGELKQVVVFLQNAPTAATTGGQYDNYTTLLTTRGRLRKKSGGRRLDYGEIGNAETYELVCRFRDDLEVAIRVDTRVQIGDYIYTVDTWERVDEQQRIYLFSLNVLKRAERVAIDTDYLIDLDETIIIDSDETEIIYA